MSGTRPVPPGSERPPACQQSPEGFSADGAVVLTVNGVPGDATSANWPITTGAPVAASGRVTCSVAWPKPSPLTVTASCAASTEIGDAVVCASAGAASAAAATAAAATGVRRAARGPGVSLGRIGGGPGAVGAGGPGHHRLGDAPLALDGGPEPPAPPGRRTPAGVAPCARSRPSGEREDTAAGR